MALMASDLGAKIAIIKRQQDLETAPSIALILQPEKAHTGQRQSDSSPHVYPLLWESVRTRNAVSACLSSTYPTSSTELLLYPTVA